MADKKEELEEGFRSALDDVVKIVEALKPFCNDLDELASMVKLAIDNRSQLRLLMNTITAPSAKR